MSKGGKRKKWIILAVVLVVVLGGLGTFKAIKGKQELGMVVKTGEVLRQDIESRIQTAGEVLSIHKREILSDVPGKVLEILVKEGDLVQKGQLLMQLDTKDIDYQIKQAEIKLNIEQETLKQLKQEDDIELHIALNNAELQYKDAKASFEQTQRLFEAGAVSKSELDAANTKLHQMNNGMILAQKNLQKAKDESRVSIQEKQIQLSQLQIDKLKEDKEKYLIKSPIEGTLVSSTVLEGSMVSPGVPFMSIQDLEQLEVVARVSEYDVDKIKIGHPVKITGDWAEENEYEGQIKYIGSNAVSISTGQGKETSVEVKISVDSKNTGLRPGFSTNVDILTESKKGVLTVPYEAIFIKKNGEKLVYTVEENKAKAHKVQTGIEGDLAVEVISSDLKENALVILNPTENLKDGDPVVENKVIKDDQNRKPQ